MNKNQTTQIGRLGTNSILVICKEGIFRLYCPFKATCIVAVESYTIGQVVTVISVKMSPDYKLVYIIQGKGFYHSSFMITSKPDHIQTTFN